MWLTVKEVAELFDTSDRTIQRRINMYSAAQKEKAEAESSMKYC